MNMEFMTKSWPELEELIKKNALIILPVAQVEEHGPHLPVGCDTYIGTEIGKRITEKLNDELPVLLMPTVWTGYSPKKMTKWPGTMRVRTRVVIDLIHDILSSLCDMGFKKIVVIDAHGQHRGMLEVAIREIADDYNVYCALTNPVSMMAEKFAKIRKSEIGGATHACEYETSLLMAMGFNIDLSKATDEDKLTYKSEFYVADAFGIKKVFLSTWGLQESKSGIYGAPLKSSVETGNQLLDEMIKNYIKFCKEYWELKTV
ncbi:MAG: creatininase family protein [Actinobacteria bacterium]|nr:creatininase family protein [Actinomycetota bacterium]